jgi:hypothetical protein
LAFIVSISINTFVTAKRAGVNLLDSFTKVISNFFGFIKLTFTTDVSYPNSIINQIEQRIIYLRYSLQHILQWYVIFYLLKNRKKFKISKFNYFIIIIISLFIITDYDK